MCICSINCLSTETAVFMELLILFIPCIKSQNSEQEKTANFIYS